MAEWTIRALMEWTEKHFAEKGIGAARLETQLLLAHSLNCTRPELYTRWTDVVDDEKRSRFRDLIKRRLEGCPIQYLTGRREFFLLEFEVTPAVLIPRPETEMLVAETLRRIKDLSEPRVLDLGTGSGCIAIAIAMRHKTARLTASDISSDALAVAQRNATRHGVAQRISFIHSDLFAAVAPSELFDVIVSNPPYVTQAEWQALPPHVRDFEPAQALVAGPDGFAVFDRLVEQAPRFLAPGGHLLLEIGAEQQRGILERLAAQEAFVPGTVLRDDAQLPRVASARRKDAQPR